MVKSTNIYFSFRSDWMSSMLLANKIFEKKKKGRKKKRPLHFELLSTRNNTEYAKQKE